MGPSFPEPGPLGIRFAVNVFIATALVWYILRYIAVRRVSVESLTGTISIGENLPLCTAARTLQPVLLPNADAIRERFPAVIGAHERDGVNAVAAFPLAAGGKVLGALLIRWKQPHTLSPVDVSFANALSRIAAESFARARLFDAERAQSLRKGPARMIGDEKNG